MLLWALCNQQAHQVDKSQSACPQAFLDGTALTSGNLASANVQSQQYQMKPQTSFQLAASRGHGPAPVAGVHRALPGVTRPPRNHTLAFRGLIIRVTSACPAGAPASPGCTAAPPEHTSSSPSAVTAFFSSLGIMRGTWAEACCRKRCRATMEPRNPSASAPVWRRTVSYGKRIPHVLCLISQKSFSPQQFSNLLQE